MNGLVIIEFLAFTILVAFIAWRKTRQEKLDSQNGYFLGGNSLSGLVICGSLVMTDLSAEQLVGNNGQAVRVGMGVWATQGLSWFGLVISAVFLLPILLRAGITTLPEYFEKRFDAATRRIISLIMLLSYVLVMLPTILYAGAQVFVNIFRVDQALNISYFAAIVIVCIAIAIVGGIYAIFGGLKAIAVSDTVNGVGMLIFGAIIPLLALGFLSVKTGGSGSVIDGLDKFLHTRPELMNAWNEPWSNEPWWPWPVIITGLVINNVYFWGTNQSIIQRALGAKNLAESQKGMILAGFIDFFTPLFLVVPGVVAALAYTGVDWGNGDNVFGTLTSDVIPAWLMGLFAAVVFGAILSSYNSVLNSASTLYALDFHKPMVNPNASDEHTVKISQRFGTVIAVVSTAVAPMLLSFSGVTTFIQSSLAIFNTPILIILLFGVLSKKTSAFAAKMTVIIHIILYCLLNYVLRSKIAFLANIHFLYLTAALFVVDVILIIVFTKVRPLEHAYIEQVHMDYDIDMTPWKHRKAWIIATVAVTVIFYAVFSPLGFGKSEKTTWQMYQEEQAQTVEMEAGE